MKEVIEQIWRFISENLAIIGPIIGVIITVVFGPRFTAKWQEKRRERNKKLRVHFEDLKKEAEPIVSLGFSSVQYGEIVFTKYDLSQAVSPSFREHFSKETEELSKLREETNKHNTRCKEFRQKIKRAFESRGIPVVQNDQDTLSSYIYERVFEPLFQRWQAVAQKSKHPGPDFQKIESASCSKGGYLLYALGWAASPLAFAKTENEREKCKRALADVAYDEQHQKEAAEIFGSANELVKKAGEFARQFAGKLDDIDRLWPGKKTNRFEMLKTCPDCKELF